MKSTITHDVVNDTKKLVDVWVNCSCQAYGPNRSQVGGAYCCQGASRLCARLQSAYNSLCDNKRTAIKHIVGVMKIISWLIVRIMTITAGIVWRCTGASSCTVSVMDVFSMIKHSLTVSDGINPITKHFRLVRQTSCAGPEMVWKIYDAVRLSDGKVIQTRPTAGP